MVWAGPGGVGNQASALDGPGGVANRLDHGHPIAEGKFRSLGLAFSSDGKRVFYLQWPRESGALDLPYQVATRSVVPGQKDSVLAARPGGVYQPQDNAIAPSPGLLATHSGPGEVRLVDLGTNRLVRRLKPPLTSGPLCFSPAGKALAIGSTRGLMFYNVRSGKLLRTVPHDDYVDALQFSPDGNKLFVTFANSKPRVIRVSDGKRLPLPRWLSNMGRAHAFALSPDGASAATAWWETVTVWSARSGKLRRKMRSGLVKVESLAFSPSGDLLALAGQSRSNAAVELLNLR